MSEKQERALIIPFAGGAERVTLPLGTIVTEQMATDINTVSSMALSTRNLQKEGALPNQVANEKANLRKTIAEVEGISAKGTLSTDIQAALQIQVRLSNARSALSR